MASIKRLEQRAELLNKMYGFKGRKAKFSKTAKRYVYSGSGFVIGQAYGGVRLEFITKSGGYKDVSDRMSKPALDDYIGGMLQALRYWSDRTKLR